MLTSGALVWTLRASAKPGGAEDVPPGSRCFFTAGLLLLKNLQV